MREQAERLRLTLQEDGGGAELAFRQVLRAELAQVFRQFMEIDDIYIDINADQSICVKVAGENLKRVGFYSV